MGMQTIKTVHSSGTSVASEGSRLSPGFSGGLLADVKILRNLYVQTGALYTFHNIKFSHKVDLSMYDLGTLHYKRYDRVYSLRLPLYAMYKSGFEGTGRFIAGVGPYAEYMLAGNRITEAPYTLYDTLLGKVSYKVVNSNNDLRFGSQAGDDMRRWDYGVTGCIGYESNVGLYFRGSFSYGLANLSPSSSGDYKLHNWAFGVSLGFLIGRDDW